MTKNVFLYAAVFGMTALGAWGSAKGAVPEGETVIRGATGTVVIPGSSFVRPEDRGIRAHTEYPDILSRPRAWPGEPAIGQI